MKELDEDDLGRLWNNFRGMPGQREVLFHDNGMRRAPSSREAMQERFLRYVQDEGLDPDRVEFCGNCGVPAHETDLNTAHEGMDVCDSCLNSWTQCSGCDDHYSPDDMCGTLGGNLVCESCRDSDYSYCEDCDGYYPDDDGESHDHHGDDGCCESPQREFTIRNDGESPLKNDTRVTVTLPKGVISPEGIKEIRYYLQDKSYYDVSYDLGKLDARWQTKEGNFTRRLSSLAYKTYGTKLPPEVLSKVGCIARDHSGQVDTEIEVTRDLNQPAGYFYHSDSCWWGSYSESRCALKTSGGFGMLSFWNDDVSGRAWVMPLRLRDGKLYPTFDTVTPDAFVVFNGYGDLNGYTAARIMAHMSGWTYRKIDFECRPMYVNSGGYLIAPENIAGKYTNGELYLRASQHSSLYETELASV